MNTVYQNDFKFFFTKKNNRGCLQGQQDLLVNKEVVEGGQTLVTKTTGYFMRAHDQI